MVKRVRSPWEPREGRKFGPAEVREIRAAVRQRGESQASVARRFGVNVRTIYECVTRMTYDEIAEDFYWSGLECVRGLGPDWLRERMTANSLKMTADRVNGKNKRKPRDAV